MHVKFIIKLFLGYILLPSQFGQYKGGIFLSLTLISTGCWIPYIVRVGAIFAPPHISAENEDMDTKFTGYIL